MKRLGEWDSEHSRMFSIGWTEYLFLDRKKCKVDTGIDVDGEGQKS